MRVAAISLQKNTLKVQHQIQRAEVRSTVQNHEIGRRVTQSSVKVSHRLRSVERRIIDHQRQLFKQLDVSTIEEENDYPSLCSPDVEPEQLSLCLGLLKPELAKVNRELAFNEMLKTSKDVAHIIQEEIQSVLLLSYQETARAAAKHGCPSPWGNKRFKQQFEARAQRTSTRTIEKSNKIQPSPMNWSVGKIAPYFGRITASSYYADRGAKGYLSSELIEHEKELGASKYHQERSRGCSVVIKFHPERDICPIGVCIVLDLEGCTRSSPSISRYIRPYTTMRLYSDAVGFADSDDELGMRHLLSAGEVSPFTRDEYGHTLVYVGIYLLLPGTY